MEDISLKDIAKEKVSELLKENGFPAEESVLNGVIELINQVADYYEEGIKLNPEIIIVGDFDVFKTIVSRIVCLYKGKIEDKEFKRLMKLCSPLATNNWKLYLYLKDDQMEYGVVSSEVSEMSLSLSNQLSGLMEENTPIIYIRNVGSKNVELLSGKGALGISFTLEGYSSGYDNNLQKLASAIVEDCQNDGIDYCAFILKLIKDALNEGHGNLIVVCKKEDLSSLINAENMTGGALLSSPIDIPQYLREDNREKSNKTSVQIKSYVSVLKAMINHDGITIFSTDGCLLGFHYIVNNSLVDNVTAVGGSRTKAFEALKKLGFLKARFFKSQDGVTKFE